eukprot:TRINITY_DN6916_c0_g3_i1.p1 TRINITY_DN6916_c0_g3~~TRINITY_DN6916_c0_g3_i1.p1  ORF type:complete len:501 (-),score=128.40 TRINITY_DN6916_c0_g3_i1:22-1524(-)
MTFLPSRTQSFLADPFPSDDTLSKVKTKIICTLGPQTCTQEMIAKMIDAGMSIARLDLCSGNRSKFASIVQDLQTQAVAANKAVAIMVETSSPFLTLKNPSCDFPLHLQEGQQVMLGTDFDSACTITKLFLSRKIDLQNIQIGCVVHTDHMKLTLRVESKSMDAITCVVIRGGIIDANTNIHVPDLSTQDESLTELDRERIEFAVEMDLDMIACARVESAKQIHAIRKISGVAERSIRVVAKIQSQKGIDSIDEIIEAADAIMVARGDLTTEVPIHRICKLQKMIIAKCNAVGKSVITATQMLESMTRNPRPTRAEATDVANAVLDGTDCVMLTTETSIGEYPCEAIRTMANICRQAEIHIDYRELYQRLRANAKQPISISESIASSAVKSSWDLNAKLIIVLTDTGASGRLVSKFRPQCPILCVTRSEDVARRLLLHRGCFPYLTHSITNSDAVFQRVIDKAVELNLCADGDVVVVTSGSLEGVPGATNILKIITVSIN